MDSNFYNQTKKFHNFDVLKMTDKERYEFIWECMLNKSCSPSTNITSIQLVEPDIDKNAFLILPSDKSSPKERLEYLKDRFRIGVMYAHIEKMPNEENRLEIFPMPCESYFGFNPDEFCMVGNDVFNPVKFNISDDINDILVNRFGIENKPFTDHWFIRNIPIDKIEFKPREMTRTIVKKGLFFNKKKTIKDTVYDIKISGKNTVQVGVLKGKNQITGESITKMIPHWNSRLNPNASEYNRFINQIYLNMLTQLPDMNSYIIVGGWEYHGVDWDNGCNFMQSYLCKLTPLFVEEIRIKNQN